jgi:ComF family protein
VRIIRGGTGCASPALLTARRLCSLLLDLLYPRDCCGCGQLLSPGDDAAFCHQCLGRVRRADVGGCTVCGTPDIATAHPCPACTRQPPAFGQARAWAYYSTAAPERNPVGRAIWALKYGRRLDVGRRLGRELALARRYPPGQHDILIPVPLHPRRLRWRGFNHACVLAAPTARTLGIPLAARLLHRTRDTESQVTLTEPERHRNVRQAFSVPCRDRVAGSRVLLVDDVLTTGATANACATALRAAGARAVDVLTLALALRA